MAQKSEASVCSEPGSWWRMLDAAKPYALGLLILIGLFFELVIHYSLKISIVYTHFYYLIVVLAGLWYGRKAVWIALVFGGFHVLVSWHIAGAVTPDSLIRALMLVIVAFVVGSVVEVMNCYRDQLEQNNQDLKAMNERLAASEGAFAVANKKLNLLSGITRHDIRNQLMAQLMYLDLIDAKETDPELRGYVVKEQGIAQTILRQIEFTKNYEDIGVNAPLWQNVRMLAENLRARLPPGEIALETRLDALEIYADPLLEKVFQNLVDNSLRHGERVRHITISSLTYGMGTIAVVYEDDGIGVHETDKERIFVKGFGKNTGLGLFLSREILAITGLTIKEAGEYGKGVRFEILVPEGKYRFSGGSGTGTR
jgi:signal transduction histidine kinase